MLSNTSKYALRAVVYLAIHATPAAKIGIKKISEELDIPSPFLGKILQTLARKKLLISTKGPNGGFALGKPAEEISLLYVVELVDGLDVFHECLIGLNICAGKEENHHKCPMHNVSDDLRLRLIDLFKNNSVAEIAKDIKKLETLLK